MKKDMSLLFIIPSNKNKEANLIEIESNQENKESVVFGEEIESTLLLDYQIPVEDIDILKQLGFSSNDVQVYEDNNLSTNENYINYILKGGIAIKADNLLNVSYLQSC